MKQISLKELRERNNVAQSRLAQHLHLNRATISLYETGKRRPSLARAIEIANYFNVPVEMISFGGKKEEEE